MKKIMFTLLVVLLFFSGQGFATETAEINPGKKLSIRIQELLKKNSFKVDADDLTAQVRFTINKEGELVVLSVDTDDANLEGFVKSRLNYQKVEVNQVKEGKIYVVPVRVTA